MICTCTEDFDFKRKKSYTDFLPVLETLCLSEYSLWGFLTVLETLSLSEKIPIENLQNPYRDDFEFERKNPYRDFPLYWGNNLLFAPLKKRCYMS